MLLRSSSPSYTLQRFTSWRFPIPLTMKGQHAIAQNMTEIQVISLKFHRIDLHGQNPTLSTLINNSHTPMADMLHTAQMVRRVCEGTVTQQRRVLLHRPSLKTRTCHRPSLARQHGQARLRLAGTVGGRRIVETRARLRVATARPNWSGAGIFGDASRDGLMGRD